MKKNIVYVQQWENEKCGPNNVLSEFKYSLHKNESSARSFINKYQKEKKVIRVENEELPYNDDYIESLCVDEETYKKVIEQDEKGEPYTCNNLEVVTLFIFS